MSRRLKTQTKICQYCGDGFHPFNSTQKFCSNKCYWDYRHKVKGEADCQRLKKCAQCGKEFKPWNYRAKYCSRECLYRARTRRADIKVCPVCQKEFSPIRVRQVYCSSYCVQEAKMGSKPQRPFSKKTEKSKRVYLDNIWSELVKWRADEQCEYCGKITNLNSHHIFSRSNHHLRWDLENGACLCVGHHTLGLFSAHKSPLEFAEFLKGKRGLKWYRDLLDKSRSLEKVDKGEVRTYLLAYKEQIEQLKLGNKVQGF